MKAKAIFTVLFMLAATVAWSAARPNIVVEGVQMPAWVEHPDGARDALTLGRALDNRDRVITGPGARALLRLVDGSFVKVGENATQALDGLGQDKAKPKQSAKASRAELAAWLKDTSIAGGAGTLRKGGKWRVYLADASEQNDALKTYDQLRNAGYAAEIRPVTSDATAKAKGRVNPTRPR